MHRLLPHYQCIFKRRRSHRGSLVFPSEGITIFLAQRLFLCGIKRYLWLKFGLYRRMISWSSSRSSVKITEEFKSLPEGARSLCRVAKKTNDMEADLLPASKSRISTCIFYIICKFVSEIRMLNILHCCAGKGVCIEEQHKMEGGDGFQLCGMAQEASPHMLLPQGLCSMWHVLPCTNVEVLGTSTVPCSGVKAYGWFPAVSETNSLQSASKVTMLINGWWFYTKPECLAIIKLYKLS